MRARQRRAERRRTGLVVGGAVTVIAVLAGVVALVLVREQQSEAALEAAAAAPIEGVQEFADLSRDHVSGVVDYPQSPPVGGDHAQVWTNCGVYPDPVETGRAVHSLEHGAVWITYRPDLPADQVQVLTSLAEGNRYVLLSPYEGLEDDVVASAWGRQLRLEEATDSRLETFARAYQQGPQTPEPGAPCTGGAGGV